ncbi:MAG: branched-chain amino acid ABC transporter permease [Candidatus Eisenbacteria sp.]|nr:branched-chain amino acid ABC transporter permease [Candidatus Eisenbacteria bacterium]
MQVVANGIITGLTIVVLALGFTAAYLPTRVFHLALGGIYAAAPFCAWTCLRLGWSPWFALGLAVLAGAGLSLACEAANHALLDRKRAPSGAHLIASLGAYIVIAQATAMIWGNEPKVLRTGVDAVTTIGGLVLTRAQLMAAAVSIGVLAIFYVWLRFSGLGLRFRALAENSVEFALRGYNVRRLRLLAFGISGVLCSTSSLLVANDVGFDAHGGLHATILAVVAVIIGGRRSFYGPLVGGLLLGLVRSGAVWFFSARWQEAVTFLLLALFLFFRPSGLLGRKGRMEADV